MKFEAAPRYALFKKSAVMGIETLFEKLLLDGDTIDDVFGADDDVDPILGSGDDQFVRAILFIAKIDDAGGLDIKKYDTSFRWGALREISGCIMVLTELDRRSVESFQREAERGVFICLSYQYIPTPGILFQPFHFKQWGNKDKSTGKERIIPISVKHDQ